jgi:hypothetical protein
MNAVAAEFSLYEESESDATELELSTTVRFQFKDACEFGRACRSLAIPVNGREEFAAA